MFHLLSSTRCKKGKISFELTRRQKQLLTLTKLQLSEFGQNRCPFGLPPTTAYEEKQISISSNWVINSLTNSPGGCILEHMNPIQLKIFLISQNFRIG